MADNKLYTKEECNYRDGNDDERCALCEHYVNARTCDIVKGRIKPSGLCNYFDAAGGDAAEEAQEGDADNPQEERAEEHEQMAPKPPMVLDGKPRDEDLGGDDHDYNPAVEPRSAKAWLNLLEESEKAFKDWNDHCDKIEERFASLKRLSSMPHDKQFQLFWANTEVLKPAIYAKEPIPVVVPKFKDRRPVYQDASELLERCCVVAFDIAEINESMLLVRDGLAMTARGVLWLRYEGQKGSSFYDSECVCVDFKHRRDFLHSLSRNWKEVEWVAGASYLTRDQARDRFSSHSGDEYQKAEYRVDKESETIGGADRRERAKFWEVWHKSGRTVLWVARGCEKILDEGDPHLELQKFFPCPKPAYGSVQPGTLIPVPDVLQYEDQVDGIDSITARIHALSDVLEVKGFYPAGGAELSEAVQAALATRSSGRVLVPISNWAAFGGTKEVIIWMPIDMIAETINTLIAVRKQLIDDVYQIMGLSDIMRGSTDPKETLGAQQLKTEYGGSRVRDKQYELQRLAKDAVIITADIITEKFDPVTIIKMSQTQLPTQEMIEQQVAQLQQQLQNQQMALQMAQQNPQIQSAMQGNPQQAQGLMQQGQDVLRSGQDAIKKLMAKTTIEQVLRFLGSNRARAFTLDIETDSTIIVDENAAKQRTTEFVGVLGQLLPQLAQMISAEPQTAGFCGELLKFATAPFRAGRQLDGAIDELVEHMKEKSDKPRGDDPVTATNKANVQIEQMKNQRQADKDKADTAMKAQELQMRNAQEQAKIASNEKLKLIELQQKQQGETTKVQAENLKNMREGEAHQVEILGKYADMHLNEQKAQLAERNAQQRQQNFQQQQYTRDVQQANRPPRGAPL